MDTDLTKTTETPTPEETPEQREKLLSALTPRNRKRVEETMEVYPELTTAEAIEALTAFGGL